MSIAIDLGSGDGRVVIAAARRFGATGMGVEKSPALVARSQENARRAGVESKVRFLEQDLFKADLAPATVVTLYLMPDMNLRLRSDLLALKPGTRVVSHRWDMGDWKPDRSVEVSVRDPRSGVPRAHTVHLWIVPLAADGIWCATGKYATTKMQLNQDYQRATGNIIDASGVNFVDAAIEGGTLKAASGGRLVHVPKDDTLRVENAAGVFERFAGNTFIRSCCGSCPPSR
jgi:SAM-dependent methyltransferase